MQVELTTEELSMICKALDYTCEEKCELLCLRLTQVLQEAEELESLDFDDCAGGACKL